MFSYDSLLSLCQKQHRRCKTSRTAGRTGPGFFPVRDSRIGAILRVPPDAGPVKSSFEQDRKTCVLFAFVCKFSFLFLFLSLSYVVNDIPAFGSRANSSVVLVPQMIIWGALSTATAACRNASHLYTVRFLLGFVEAAYFPGCRSALSNCEALSFVLLDVTDTRLLQVSTSFRAGIHARSWA